MKLKIASKEAILYSCKYFHYAQKAPAVILGFSVFNNKLEWCGVICFGKGSNPQIGNPYKLAMGEVVELVRVALNGKQEQTSKAVSISLKLLKKYAPLVKLIVSYADSKQGHLGKIYQATNWFYVGESYTTNYYEVLTGKLLHSKTGSEKYKGKRYLYLTLSFIPLTKYLFPLYKSLIPLCKSLSKPYPKNAKVV